MSNLIDRDEVLKLIKRHDEKIQTASLHKLYNQVYDLPLQQQGGNDRIKELIEKKIVDGFRKGTITKSQNEILRELLSEIDNLPPNN